MVYFILLLVLVLLAYMYMLWLAAHAWDGIEEFKAADIEGHLPYITIIIPARNEEKNIGNCLQSIVGQHYPVTKRQIIVVNDHSTDATATIAESFRAQGVELIDMARQPARTNNSFKKLALQTAIAQATGTLILTTDADCRAQPNWLKTIAAFYNQYKPAAIVLPVYMHATTGWLQHFQMLDFMMMQGITGAAIARQWFSMCNGANFCYEKRAYDAVNGFENIDSMASGDDMLLLQKIIKNEPAAVHYLKSKEVVVTTKAESSFTGFMQQRIRWASKSKSYNEPKIQTVLLLVYILNLMVLAAVAVAFLFWSKVMAATILFVLIAKACVELFFMKKLFRFFQIKDKTFIFLMLQPLHILYIVLSGLLGLLTTYRWKGRKVR